MWRRVFLGHGLLFVLAVSGCGSPAPQVDEEPFRQAIGRYLESHNMAMKIKAIKEGPVVEGDAASLTASMTHAQLGGPSVTWVFQFAKQSDGKWQVTSYAD